MPTSGENVAIDTNVAIALLNGRKDAAQSILQFNQVLIPLPVIGELRYGALHSKRAAENLKHIELLVSRCDVIEMTRATAIVYADVRSKLRRAGKPIPENECG